MALWSGCLCSEVKPRLQRAQTDREARRGSTSLSQSWAEARRYNATQTERSRAESARGIGARRCTARGCGPRGRRWP